MAIDWGALVAPFPSREIKWRVGSTTKDKKKGLALAYIDSRAVMDRLDSVCGPQNWARRHEFGNAGEILCSIGINVLRRPYKAAEINENEIKTYDPGASEWVWKSDGAGLTDFEAVKGGLSDSFKRAAVSWGIGRYLYQLEGIWCPIEQRGKSYYLKETPDLPRWALPADETKNTISEDEVREIYSLAEDYGWDKATTIHKIVKKFNVTPEYLTKKEAEQVKRGLSNGSQ